VLRFCIYPTRVYLSGLASNPVQDLPQVGESSAGSHSCAMQSQSHARQSAAQSAKTEPSPTPTGLMLLTSTIPPSSDSTLIQNALTSLNKTKLVYLASPSLEPPRSTDPAPRQTVQTHTIMATTMQTSVLDAALGVSPSMENEILLLAALQECKFILYQLKLHTYELQASNVLNEAYAAQLKA